MTGIPGVAAALAVVGVIALTWNSSVGTSKRCWYLVGTLTIGSLPFIMLMSLIFATAEIRTDKEFYRTEDDVLVSARRAGYIFLPHINEIEFGRSRVALPGEGTVDFTAKDHNGSDLIIARFTPQLLSTRRNAYHSVLMVK